MKMVLLIPDLTGLESRKSLIEGIYSAVKRAAPDAERSDGAFLLRADQLEKAIASINTTGLVAGGPFPYWTAEVTGDLGKGTFRRL